MKIVICCSMSFASEALQAKAALEGAGHTITVPQDIELHVDGGEEAKELERVNKGILIRGYYAEIAVSDAVLVLNYEKKGIPGYVGANCLIEAAYAFALEKPLYLLNPIPDGPVEDELQGMVPVILNGDLSRL